VKPLISIVGGVILSVFALPALASAQDIHPGPTKKSQIHLSSAIVIGNKTVQPGDYYLQCRHTDGGEFLVATTVVDEVEVARVACKPSTLEAKVKESEFRTIRKEGAEVLTSARFKGETVAHVVATN
jgi:hypothetical protein